MFKKAIVRKPGRSLINGLRAASLGNPDYNLALSQHLDYIDTLRRCGLEVTILEASEEYPDSVFVEDVALCTDRCAVITRPGAISRRGEAEEIKEVIYKNFDTVEEISYPGTIEAGDIMMVDNHFFIGLSDRTNLAGAEQMLSILQSHGFTGSTVPLYEVLHLKTGVSYLEDNNLLTWGEFISSKQFSNYNRIVVPLAEGYAANSLWINGKVLIPSGHPETAKLIKQQGYKIIELNMSEFQKLDGGLSCLSLRF